MKKRAKKAKPPAPIVFGEADLSKELIEYLSKEIETVTNGMMVFRSRISFAVLVGPFLILGTLVYAAKDLPGSKQFGFWEWLLAGGIGVFYLTLAFLSGRIEEDGWRQCNVWKELSQTYKNNPKGLLVREICGEMQTILTQ